MILYQGDIDMKKRDIGLLLRSHSFGRGYRTDVWLNGSHVGNIAEAIKVAKEGDTVQFWITSIRGWGETIVSFKIESNPRNLEFLRKQDDAAKLHRRKRRDFQRQKVYDTEYAIVKPLARHISVEKANAILDEIVNLFGRSDRPEIQVSRRLKKYSYYDPHENKIALQSTWGLSDYAVIHESAHWLLRGEGVIAHGEEFVYIVSLLYSLFIDGFSMEAFKQECDNNGVKYAADVKF